MGLRKKFTNIWEIIKHPVKSYDRINNYDEIIKQRNDFRNEKDDLFSKNLRLEYEVENLDVSLRQSKRDNVRARVLVEKAIKACLNVHTNPERMYERAEANKSNNAALIAWQEPFEKKMAAAEKEAEFLRQNSYGLATDVAMESVINLDPRVKRVPFIFYNTVTKKFSYTPATLKFFKVKAEDAEGLTFAKLLLKVGRDYLNGGEGVLAALRNGTKLSHYDAKTCGENPIDLKLTTYPVTHLGKSLGIGILVYDPKISLKSKRNKKLITNLDKIFHEMTENLTERLGELSRQREIGFI